MREHWGLKIFFDDEFSIRELGRARDIRNSRLGVTFSFCPKVTHLTLDEGKKEDNDDKDLFGRYLLCCYDASDIVPDSGDALINQTDTDPVLLAYLLLVRHR